MFWVTDNFLMHRTPRNRRLSADRSLIERVKVRYRSIRAKNKIEDSESDVLLSADEELLGSHESLQQRTTAVAI